MGRPALNTLLKSRSRELDGTELDDVVAVIVVCGGGYGRARGSAIVFKLEQQSQQKTFGTGKGTCTGPATGLFSSFFFFSIYRHICVCMVGVVQRLRGYANREGELSGCSKEQRQWRDSPQHAYLIVVLVILSSRFPAKSFCVECPL
jgi:hypothetical protein